MGRLPGSLPHASCVPRKDGNHTFPQREVMNWSLWCQAGSQPSPVGHDRSRMTRFIMTAAPCHLLGPGKVLPRLLASQLLDRPRAGR